MFISKKKYEKRMCEMYDLGMQSLHEESYDIFKSTGMIIDSLVTISDKNKKKEILDKLECVRTEVYALEKKAGKLVYVTRPSKKGE